MCKHASQCLFCCATCYEAGCFFGCVLCLAIPLFGLLLIVGGALVGLAIGLGLFPQDDSDGMVYRMMPEYATNNTSINSTLIEKLIES